VKKVVSLFTGAGGLDLGLEAAGFETSVAIEFNKHACETLRVNRRESRPWDVLEGDIHEISSDEILARAGARVGEITLLVGGPPCQPFSKSAYWARGDTKRLDDPRADTLSAYLRVLKDIQPRAFLLENVFGLTYRGKDEALHLLQNTVDLINRDIGTDYSFNWKILNAANFGVPQIRERFFLVGLRNGSVFEFPRESHFDASSSPATGKLLPFDQSENLLPWSTSWDALGDLVGMRHPNLQVTGKWADLLPSIPEGENYLWHTKRKGGLPLFRWRSRYWSFLLKLSKSRPSWTVQAQPGAGIGPFHWENRRLSSQEMMRLQTFPSGYQIAGGHTEQQRQLGNAVPSLMGEILGRELMSQLFGANEVLRVSPTLVPPNRLPVPAPCKVKCVPSQFRQLPQAT